jgi:hypothetical protein
LCINVLFVSYLHYLRSSFSRLKALLIIASVVVLNAAMLYLFRSNPGVTMIFWIPAMAIAIFRIFMRRDE